VGRRAALFVLQVSLDRTSDVPMHLQIYQAVVQAIRSGAVSHPVCIPSSRLMASMLGVFRNTVLKAYDKLVADGLIEGAHCSGMRARLSDATGGAGRLERKIERTLQQTLGYKVPVFIRTHA
jgi:GntR family transcriptional regulator/MocR family aminotransferase